MAEYGEHIIRKLRFEISVEDPGQAGELQSRISDLVSSGLEAELDRLFGETAGDRHLVVERMEVDLGMVSSVGLEEELLRGIRQKLKDRLISMVRGAEAGVEGRERWKDTDELFMEALVYYLHTGSYPWYVTRQMEAERLQDPEKLLMELAESHPSALKGKVREGLKDDYFLKRVARRFGDRSLARLAGLFSPALETAFKEVFRVTEILSRLRAGPFSPGRQAAHRYREIMLSRLGQTLPADTSAETASHFLYSALIGDLELPGSPAAPGERHRELLRELWKEQAGEDGPDSSPAGSGELKKTGLGRLILRQAEIERLLLFLQGREEDRRYYREDEQYAVVTAPWLDLFLRMAGAADYAARADELMEKGERVEEGGRRLPVSALRELANDLSAQISSFTGAGKDAGKGEEAPDSAYSEDESGADKTARRKIDTEDTGEREYFVSNGGLVLLWPYLARLFRRLEFVVDGEFIEESSRLKAVHLLQYLVTGSVDTHEYRMVLNKVLCGCELNYPLPSSVDFSESEKEEAEEVIQSAVDHWKALKDTSPEGFRDAFIQRHARLSREESHWILQVEPEAWDVLLDRLPWSLSVVRLPWMTEPLHVEWR